LNRPFDQPDDRRTQDSAETGLSRQDDARLSSGETTGHGDESPDDVMDTSLVPSDVVSDLARFEAGGAELPVFDPRPAVEAELARGPDGQVGVAWHCSSCRGEIASTLPEIASGLATCRKCDSPIVPGRTCPDLPALVALVLYEANFLTKTDPTVSLAWTEQVLAVDPDSGDAHNIAGIILDERGDHATALAHFRRAVEIDPLRARFHHGLGYALLTHGSVDEACREFERALEIFPDYMAALIKLCAAYADNKEWVASALSAYKLCKLDPGGPFAEVCLRCHQEIINRLRRLPPTIPQPSSMERMMGRQHHTSVDNVGERLRGNHFGHIASIWDAFDMIDQGRASEAATQFEVLRALLPENSAGHCLVSENAATAYGLTDSHRLAHERSMQARRYLPCVTALVSYPGQRSVAGLTLDAKRFYRGLIKHMFGVECALVTEIRETLRSGAIRVSVELRSAEQSYRVRRTGNVVRITPTSGEEVVYHILEESYVAYHGL
jgi:tetratricopeptide (TPR) repeat protein